MTRYAAAPRLPARIFLAALALLLLAALGSTAVSGTDDGSLYAGVVDSVRHGGDYYAATAETLRLDGHPLRPFLAFRLPTLVVTLAWLGPVASALLLYVLALGTLYAWHVRLADNFPRPIARTLATLLIAVGMVSAVQARFVAIHEVWAGLLIAFSLAVRRPGHWIEATALGLAAALIRETAALYLLVMTVAALIDGDRREATGWLVASAVFAIVLACHAYGVAQVTGPLDRGTGTAVNLAGFGFAMSALARATVLALVPAWIGAPIVTIAIFGWSAWRDPLAARVLAMLVVVLLLLCFVADPATDAGALLVAPLVLPGLAFAVPAVRDLVRAALDRRRITVTRITR